MYQLTKMDIAALKTADTIIARYNRRGAVSCLEAIKDACDTNPWEQRHIVDVGTATTCYTRTGESFISQVDSAHALMRMWHGSVTPMHTVVSLLKPGDSLIVTFTASNNNGYLNDAHLHCDQCSITIVRNADTAKPQRMLFLLESSISPDNLARMCSTSVRQEYAHQAS